MALQRHPESGDDQEIIGKSSWLNLGNDANQFRNRTGEEIMRQPVWAKLLVTCALCSLGACGGGGGGGGSSALVSTPAPPPPPPPPNYAKIFPNITQSTNFAVLGIQANAFDTPASALVTSGFAVSFDAAAGAYIIDLPSANPSKYVSTGGNIQLFYGYLEDTNYYANVLKPSATNTDIQLSHTSFAQYYEYDYDDYAPTGFVAFGTATPAGSVPTTGTATMDAIVRGLTLNGDATVGGTAALQFNFGAGTLAGHFNPVLLPYGGGSHSLGQYTFTNTVFGVGSTTFSGAMSHVDPALTGAFNGLFTGPNAQELMARWSARYFVPGVTPEPGEMFGIWVGKRP